jgi:hypothetical protein
MKKKKMTIVKRLLLFSFKALIRKKRKKDNDIEH